MANSAYHKIRTVRAPAPRGCPVDHAFSPFAPEYVANPYAVLAKHRDGSPIFYCEQLGYLVITRMKDVAAVFTNPDVFSSENVQDPVLPICDAAAEVLSAADYDPIAVMSNRPRPDHTRIRKYTQAGFSGRRIRALTPYVRERCETLVEGMLESGAPVEFVANIGHPLPGETIFRLLGFPRDDDAQIQEWTTNRLAFTWGNATEDEQVEIARKMLAYWRYCVSFVQHRHQVPADDFTSELLAAHDADPADLSYKEVESVVYGLSFAGHEIVSNFLGNALICLLSRRENWEAICTDPTLIPNALEEVLRFNSPQTSWRRVAARDTQIGGFKVPAGTQIFLSLGAANHDGDLYENPETFDIRRKNARTHISFGRGIHFCLGNRLALLEARITLETLVERVPSLRLVEGQALDYFPNFTFRGPKELWLQW
ncbi:cytochrome P450 [Candidatus Rariloculus sp.]|uniref:cytochrome P450 n=1 Tax=Candidatus Rariloculus sp. TaxID=3101265 RepID=UPI003D1015AF